MVAESTQSVVAITNKMDFFINALGVFATILIGIFGVLAVVLGFLVWRHAEMRKKAQEELEKIEEIADKVETIYEHLELVVAAVQTEATLVMNKSAQISKSYERAEGNKKKMAAAIDEVNKFKSEIEFAAKSLATISKVIPSASISPSISPSPTSAQIDQRKKMLRERVARLSGKSSDTSD